MLHLFQYICDTRQGLSLRCNEAFRGQASALAGWQLEVNGDLAPSSTDSENELTIHSFSTTTGHDEMKFVNEQDYADTLLGILFDL